MSPRLPGLFSEKHAEFLKGLDKEESDNIDSLEYFRSVPLRMGGVYWCLSALKTLKKCPSVGEVGKIELFIQNCFNEEKGGFSHYPGHDPHLTSTHYALLSLLLLQRKDLIQEKAPKLQEFVLSLLNEDGSFSGDSNGEVDSRFAYNGLASLSIISGSLPTEGEKVKRWILKCQNFDGAFGPIPGAESHAAYTFCAVAALSLVQGGLDSLHGSRVCEWLAERQVFLHGGFNGRPEKAPDVCYSWWILSTLWILNKQSWVDLELLRGFILCSQDEEGGGIADRPGDVPDVFHTFFGLAGLSLIEAQAGGKGEGEGALEKVHPVWSISEDLVKELSLPELEMDQ